MRQLAPLALAFALMGSLACAGGVDDAGEPARPGGSSNPSRSGGSSGGSVNPGQGGPGIPVTGSGGRSGTGGSSSGSGGSGAGFGGASGGGGAAGSAGGAADGGAADAGASSEAGPSAPLGCALKIYPVSPARLTGLPAGESYRLRLEARPSGVMVPAAPMWRWRVTHGGTEIPVTTVGGDPAVVELTTALTGIYDISAEILGTTPPCADAVKASALLPNQQVKHYLIRATPPAGSPLAPKEVDFPVEAARPYTGIVNLTRGQELEVDAVDGQLALTSYYVRVTSPQSTSRLEGWVTGTAGGAKFRRRVDASSILRTFDVLVVPDVPTAMTGQPVLPPKLFSGLRLDQFPVTTFMIEAGARVEGTTRLGTAPLGNARLRLRAGLLPSTVGWTNTAGSYELFARPAPGRFEVRVLPPSDSGLPEAILPESSGLLIAGAAVVPLDFTYKPTPTSSLDLTVLTPQGTAPGLAMEVLLESLPGALPDVGSFDLPGGITATASGVVRLVRTSAASGTLRFDKLPRVRYKVTVTPPEALPGSAAITTAEISLEGTQAAVSRTVTLARRSRILGQLTPVEVASGLNVRGLDSGEDGIRRVVTATVGADGHYQLPVDPGRVYRLFVDPPPDRRVPRVALTPVRARATDLSDVQKLPRRLSVSGHTRSGADAVSGVVLQVFCLGAAPDCIDPAAADVSNTLPVDETVSGADGSYQLYVPDPGE